MGFRFGQGTDALLSMPRESLPELHIMNDEPAGKDWTQSQPCLGSFESVERMGIPISNTIAANLSLRCSLNIYLFAAATFLRASSRSFVFTQTSKYGRLIGSPIFPPASSSRVIPRRTTIGSSESPNGNSP